MAELHLDQLKSGDLVLLDRGYPAFWLFVLILKREGHFCARMNLEGWKVVEQFLATGLDEQIVTLEPADEARRACQERKLSTAPIKVRLLRILLNTGEIKVLVTSLLVLQRKVAVFNVFRTQFGHRKAGFIGVLHAF